jgi:hypothetical protein
LDQVARVAGGFVGVGLFEFCVGDGEDDSFDNVIRVASEFQVAMISGAAGDDEVGIVDTYDLQAVTNEVVNTTAQFSSKGRELNRFLSESAVREEQLAVFFVSRHATEC